MIVFILKHLMRYRRVAARRGTIRLKKVWTHQSVAEVPGIPLNDWSDSHIFTTPNGGNLININSNNQQLVQLYNYEIVGWI